MEGMKKMTTNSKLRQNAQKYSIFLILIAMFIICSILSPYFLTSNNLINILRQTCVGLLIAYGEMILIIAGFLDLSVASVLALSGVLAVDTYRHTQSLILSLVVAIVVSILCNLFNAFFVAQFDVPAFIATLGMQEIARGIALYYCGGSNILQLGDFVVLGQGTVGPIPIPVIIVFVISFIIWYLVNETRWGRSLYAIGGNRNAAVASGINVKVSIYKAYIINGIMAAFAGVIFMARNNAGLPNGAVGYGDERSDGGYRRRYFLYRRYRNCYRNHCRCVYHRVPGEYHELAGNRLLYPADHQRSDRSYRCSLRRNEQEQEEREGDHRG